MGVLKVKSGGTWIPVAQGVGIASPGLVGFANASVDTSGIGATMTDVTGMSVAFTAIAGHTYKTTAILSCYPTAAAATIVAQIANAGGTLIKREFVTVTSANYYATVKLLAIESNISGAQTRKVQINTSAGTLVTWSAATTAMIVVEDITSTIMDGNYPTLSVMNSAGGTAPANTSPIIMTHTTPVVPVGRQVLITWNVRFAQTTTAVFDMIHSASPGSFSANHQFGGGALTSGIMHTYQRGQAGTGAAVVAQTVVNTWGGQPVSYGPQCSITSLIL